MSTNNFFIYYILYILLSRSSRKKIRSLYAIVQTRLYYLFACHASYMCVVCTQEKQRCVLTRVPFCYHTFAGCEVDARVQVYNHRKKILSLPKCGWKPPERTRRLGTSGNDDEEEEVRVKWMEVYRYSTVTFFRLLLPTLSQSLYDYTSIPEVLLGRSSRVKF